MKILDCTLRDGGYYTNWDFDRELIDQYLTSVNLLPIDYIEIGYRNNTSDSYIGQYGYCPIYRLREIKKQTNKKIAIMLNEKDVRPSHLANLTIPIRGLVDMIRLAIDPKNMQRALFLAKELKKQGFEVGYNVMYMSKWDEMGTYTDILYEVNESVDLFCMVDSFGSMTPNMVINTIDKIKEYINIPLGFHAHNNLELALANALVAQDKGVDFLDSTVLGMGRGAGNLKTELLLTYLNKANDLDVDFNILSNIVSAFTPLLNKCKWGTNLPYMISGANSFQQKEVMSWVNNRSYSFNSIVKTLNDRRVKNINDAKYTKFKPILTENVLIVGGGENALIHFDGIKEFIKSKPDFAIIHVTTRNAKCYQEIDKSQYFCLVGNEAQRMKQIFGNITNINGICILSPSPRIFDVEVPSFMEDKTYELDKVRFTEQAKDSCTAVAFQLALSLEAKNIYIVGYDGYPDGLDQKEMDLSKENELLIRNLLIENKNLMSLTPTLYTDLVLESLYSKL